MRVKVKTLITGEIRSFVAALQRINHPGIRFCSVNQTKNDDVRRVGFVRSHVLTFEVWSDASAWHRA